MRKVNLQVCGPTAVFGHAATGLLQEVLMQENVKTV